jgi:hypothetical protein
MIVVCLYLITGPSDCFTAMVIVRGQRNDKKLRWYIKHEVYQDKELIKKLMIYQRVMVLAAFGWVI